VEKTAIGLNETGLFSPLFLDYVQSEEKLETFYVASPTLASFQGQIEQKASAYPYRTELLSAISAQYQNAELSESQKQSLSSLSKPNCFTITTGHQLALATGPLYFVYKILTTIKLAETLRKQYPAFDFVPVFWMATEDHDFLEINHFHLFGKKYEWQKEASGAVGRLSLEGLSELFAQVPDCPLWLKELYANSSNLAEATRHLVNHLFGEYGLLVLDGEDKSLKSLFVNVMEKDLLQGAYSPLIRKASSELESMGYKAQAFVRDINFFYLGDGQRNRIEKDGDGFVVLQSEQTFTADELSQAIRHTPEKFSPNVLLRPLYQETILPNLAYIGGPGELAYWLQLKSVFELEGVPFPLLIPRSFVSVIPSSSAQKLEELELGFADLFLSEQDFHQLLHEKLHVEKFDFSEEEQLLAQLRAKLSDKAIRADKTLVQAAGAEMAKTSKSIADFQKRLDKAVENRHAADLNKFLTIRKKLFPNGEPQERHDSFLNFYINHPRFIEELYQVLDPLDFRMNCVVI
jgi:bacillithiol synthase